MQHQTGQLWVVATPIGNLQDLSPRAVDTLKQVDVVLAEDTRITRRLLDAHGVTAVLESVHEHNESQVSDSIVQRLMAGARMALVSDAGTPLLSDPGFRLLRLVQEHGVGVRVVPGPSAVTAALSVAGLPTRPFWFEGFLPPRREARRQRLVEIGALQATLVFFEAPHRVRECVKDMVEVLGGDREAAFARELSKRFEEVRRDTLDAISLHLEAHPPRGEYVLMVGRAPAVDAGEVELERVLRRLVEVLPTREAAAAAADITGAKRNEAYALALRLREEGS